jgi:hypothetical protein
MGNNDDNHEGHCPDNARVGAARHEQPGLLQFLRIRRGRQRPTRWSDEDVARTVLAFDPDAALGNRARRHKRDLVPSQVR